MNTKDKTSSDLLREITLTADKLKGIAEELRRRGINPDKYIAEELQND